MKEILTILILILIPSCISKRVDARQFYYNDTNLLVTVDLEKSLWSNKAKGLFKITNKSDSTIYFKIGEKGLLINCNDKFYPLSDESSLNLENKIGYYEISSGGYIEIDITTSLKEIDNCNQDLEAKKRFYITKSRPKNNHSTTSTIKGLESLKFLLGD